MMAVIAFATIAGPIGLLGVGPLLQAYGARTVFVVIAARALGSALFFVGVVTRYRASAAVAEAV